MSIHVIGSMDPHQTGGDAIGEAPPEDLFATDLSMAQKTAIERKEVPSSSMGNSPIGEDGYPLVRQGQKQRSEKGIDIRIDEGQTPPVFSDSRSALSMLAGAFNPESPEPNPFHEQDADGLHGVTENRADVMGSEIIVTQQRQFVSDTTKHDLSEPAVLQREDVFFAETNRSARLLKEQRGIEGVLLQGRNPSALSEKPAEADGNRHPPSGEPGSRRGDALEQNLVRFAEQEHQKTIRSNGESLSASVNQEGHAPRESHGLLETRRTHALEQILSRFSAQDVNSEISSKHILREGEHRPAWALGNTGSRDLNGVRNVKALARSDQNGRSLQPGEVISDEQDLLIQKSLTARESSPFMGTGGRLTIQDENIEGFFPIKHAGGDDLRPMPELLTRPAVNTADVLSPSMMEKDQAQSTVDQVFSQMRVLLSRGKEKMTIQLYPEFLGKLRMHVTIQGHRVVTEITADSSMARDLISHHVHTLRESFAEQGLQLEKFSVSLQQENMGSSSGHPGQNFRDALPQEQPGFQGNSEESRERPVQNHWVSDGTVSENGVNLFA